MSASTSLPKWKATAKFQWRTWGDECAIYNTASGDTHILDLTSGQILKILEEQAADVPNLVEASAAKLRLDADPGFVDRIEQLVAKFQDLDLIEPVIQ